MSADLLREAAAKAREEWGDPTSRRVYAEASRTHLAVADWLDEAAGDDLHPLDPPCVVARAYLGRTS